MASRRFSACGLAFPRGWLAHGASPCPVAPGLGAWRWLLQHWCPWTGASTCWHTCASLPRCWLGRALVSLTCGRRTGLHVAALAALVPPPPQRIIGYHWWPRPHACHCCQGHLADLHTHQCVSRTCSGLPAASRVQDVVGDEASLPRRVRTQARALQCTPLPLGVWNFCAA